MENVFDTLKARGFIKQTVYEEDLYKKLGSEHMSFYIGFDRTACTSDTSFSLSS